ncbi:hypothetical protein AO843_22135 [Lysinibacillus sp. ZYM-1]|nr:hypothetical protein AO843_22135 [Lysinibacillus sp. ZYM-1]
MGNNGMDQAPLDEAVRHANPHHYIVGAQSSLPVDAAGNPWNGSWVSGAEDSPESFSNWLIVFCTSYT